MEDLSLSGKTQINFGNGFLDFPKLFQFFPKRVEIGGKLWKDVLENLKVNFFL